MAIFSNNREFLFKLRQMVIPKRPEAQLKNIDSIIDRRIWSLDKNEQRQYFYEYIRAYEVDGLNYLSALIENLEKRIGTTESEEAIAEEDISFKPVTKKRNEAALLSVRQSEEQPVDRTPIETPTEEKLEEEWEGGGQESYGRRFETLIEEEETDEGQEVIIPNEEDILFKGQVDVDESGLINQEDMEENIPIEEPIAKRIKIQETPVSVIPEPISKIPPGKDQITTKALDTDSAKDREIRELKNKLADCMQDLNERDYYLSQAMEKLENLHSILTTNKDLKDKVEIYNMKIRELQKEKDRLKQEKEDAMDKVKHLESGKSPDQSQALQQQLDEYKAKVETLEEEEKELLHMYLTESKMLLLEVENLKKALNKYQDMEKQLQEMKMKAAEAEELRHQLKSGDTSLDCEKQLQEAQKKLDLLEKDLELVEKDRNALMQRTTEDLLSEREASQKLDEDLSVLKQRLKAMTDERDALKEELNELTDEAESWKYQAQNCNSKFASLQHEYDLLDSNANDNQENYFALEQNFMAMKEECDILKSKLLDLEGLEVALQDLENKLANMQNIIAERDMLRMKLEDLAGLEAELENFRSKAQEADLLRTDRDRLKQALDEHIGIEIAYKSLLEKTKNMEVITAERNMFKSKFEELVGLEVEVKALRNLVDRLKGADEERDCLRRKVKELECAIADQEDEIKRLLIQIELLSMENYSKKGNVTEMTESLVCRCLNHHEP